MRQLKERLRRTRRDGMLKHLTLLATALIAGCAATSDGTHNTANVPSSTPDATAAVPYLRPLRNTGYYPPAAKKKRIQGRLLIEYGIDESGKARNMQLVNEDAPPLLIPGAWEIMSDLRFDLPKTDVERITSTTFRTAVLFCIRSCKDVKAFPGIESIHIVTDLK